MKFNLIFLGLLLWNVGFAEKGHNPFSNRMAPKIRKDIGLKYQYLGFIQNSNQGFAFIKAVGADIERVQKGQSIGIGRIVYFDIKKICMHRHKQYWCLLRSTQSVNWKKEDGGIP
jgi:hypothetical protein